MKAFIHRPMMFFARSLVLAAFAVGCSQGEEVSVFACDGEIVRIPKTVVHPTPKTGDAEVKLTVYRITERVGKIQTGESDLAGLTKRALAEDQSSNPFFADGFKFILRDTKGRHYIVFFEYVKGHKTFTGFRAALAPLDDLGSKGAVFTGNPFLGVIFDKELLAQLKAIVERRLAGQEDAGDGNEPSE